MYRKFSCIRRTFFHRDMNEKLGCALYTSTAVSLYCMGSTREHVLSIDNGFDVPYVSALRGRRLGMFSGFLHFDFDNRSAPVGPF